MPRSRRKAVAATARIHAISCATMSNERRAEPRDDLLSQLIAAEAGRAEALRRTNSSRPRSCFSMPAMRRPSMPSAMASRRCSSMGFAPMTIRGHVEELLRFDAPLASLHPLCAGRCRLRGLKLAARARQIGLLLGAANRDPARFRRSRPFRSRARAQSACEFRRRHPFLRRRAAGPARNAGGAADPVRAPAAARLWPKRRAIATAIHFHGLERLDVTF